MRRDVKGSGPEWRPLGWGSLLVALSLCPALTPVTARAQGAPSDSVTLSWTAPGDDGRAGTATGYEVRRSPSPIDDANWSAATVVPGTPVPLPAGTRQRMVVRGLTYGTTYYFAITSVDDAGNWSGLSNVVRWDWLADTGPPSAPSGVSAAMQMDSTVRVTWTPNSEADLAGYHLYRGLASGGPFIALNGSLITAAEYVDSTIPPGTETVWYQVSAQDVSGNESARSTTYVLKLVAQTTTWAMDTGYPNPSRAGATVHIPVVVAGSGETATLEIVNSSGQRVRRLDLGTRPPGPTEVQWDGRNDAGREVAPGVYTAWLIAGTTRVSVRLVREP